MAHILSCGHREDDFDKQYNVITKSSSCDEDGFKKAIAYSTVCKECKDFYIEEDLLFETEDEAIKWLQSDSEF